METLEEAFGQVAWMIQPSFLLTLSVILLTDPSLSFPHKYSTAHSKKYTLHCQEALLSSQVACIGAVTLLPHLLAPGLLLYTFFFFFFNCC